MIKFRSPIAPLLWLILIPALLSGSCQKDTQAKTSYSLQQAQKVFASIDKITAETQQPWDGPQRSITITESEFNSYIAYRIEAEKEEIMKELRLKFFDKNKLEGKVHIDLRGQDVPSFIRPEMDVYFSANLLIDNGKAKVDIQELFLGDEPIKPFIIDLVIGISARLNNQEATSISDWYELPYGIKDIKTEDGKATFFY
jgi:hypothetical protein